MGSLLRQGYCFKFLVGLTLSLFVTPAKASSSSAAEREYGRLRPIFHRLEHTAKPPLRDKWEQTIRGFETLAKKFPDSPQAPRALFSAARLWRSLHAWSGVGRDLDYSLAAYDRLVGRYPKNSLADDSLIAQAEILQSKRAEYTGARQKLKAVVERYGSGDQVHLAREMLGDLPGAKKVRKPEAKVQSKKFRVILDPGHGGHDAGALGERKLQEKDVVLAIAQELATLLRSAGIEVLLTRERDTFVSLDQRASFANRHQGDLLISIHANAHENRNVGGVETYYLDVSNRRYKGRLRHAMRNQKKAINDLNYILSDLSTKADTRASLILAQQVQGKLVPALRSAGGKIRDLGTKAAVFQILIDTQMPSVLAEVAFVSNPHEGRFLRSGMGQKRVASALYEAVLNYRKKMASVQQKSLAVLSEKR